jgi:hypothetical protein
MAHAVVLLAHGFIHKTIHARVVNIGKFGVPKGHHRAFFGQQISHAAFADAITHGLDHLAIAHMQGSAKTVKNRPINSGKCLKMATGKRKQL